MIDCLFTGSNSFFLLIYSVDDATHLRFVFFILICLAFLLVCEWQARSKLPKKRRRVLPVEQPRRKREVAVTNRRTNALKHQHTHPTTQTHPPVLKDAFGTSKPGHGNGVNVISSAAASNQPMSATMSARVSSMCGSSGVGSSQMQNSPGLLLSMLILMILMLRKKTQKKQQKTKN